MKCSKCQKDIQEAAVTCPSCGHQITAAEREQHELDKKKGCGGCLLIMGLLILIAGLGTFIAARKSASNLIQNNYENQGMMGVAADETLAPATGHGTYSDYLTEQNRNSGILFSLVGVVLVYFGVKKVRSAKPKT